MKSSKFIITLLSVFSIGLISCSKKQECPVCNCECDKDEHKDDETPKEPKYHEWVLSDPLKFKSESTYKMEKALDELPLTFEATINLPASVSERAGVIVGNFNDKVICISFEIYSNGNPRLYFCDRYGTTTNILFNNVKVNTGTDLHLAIVSNLENRTVDCYVDGVKKQSISKYFFQDLPDTPLLVGGDARSGNGQYFKGSIYNVSLYKSARTEEEILEDTEKVNVNHKDLLAAYDLSGAQDGLDIEDLAGKIKLISDTQWVSPDLVETPKNYDYSMAIIGDTQIVTKKYPTELHKIYDYVLDKKESDKIAYCIGLGDITDGNSDTEWELAKSQIDRMNNKVPYLVNRGNHDSSAQFNKYFGPNNSFYSGSFDGSLSGQKNENTYRFLDAGKENYLIFTLDYGASDNVLEWAGGVIEDNPECKVIITTHGYLFRDGTTLDQNDVCPPATTGGYNNGDHMWNKLMSQYENIQLVLCGHDPTDNIVVAKTRGEADNIVTQILVDPQGVDVASPTGMVAMFYFSNGGNTIDVRYYSTVKEMYLKKSNQMRIELDKE